MSSFDIVKLITVRELIERGRTKAYLLSAGLTLVIVTGIVVVPTLLGGGETVYELGSLGEGNQAIFEVTETIAAENAGEDGFSLEVTEYRSRYEAVAGLEAGEVEFVLIDGSEVLREGSTGFGGSDAQDDVQRAAAIVELEGDLAGSSADPATVAGALSGQPLPVSSLIGESNADEEAARSLIAYVGMFLLYMAILLYGNWTLQGIAEEKASRIVEVLLAAVKPWHLLTGKVLGIGLLGLAQFALTVGWGLLLLRVTDSLPLPAIPVDSAVALLVWFVLGYAVYSVLYAMVGSLVSRMEDAQSVSFPITMVVIVGFIVSLNVLDSPSGLVAQITTFVPFISPFVVPVRVAFSEITAIEYAGSILVTLLTVGLLIRLAARVYAGGLLSFSNRVSFKKAFSTVEGR